MGKHVVLPLTKCANLNYGVHLYEHANEYTEEQYYAQAYSTVARAAFLAANSVDLSKIISWLSSEENGKPLETSLLLEPVPWEDSNLARRRELMALELYTVE